MTTESGGAFLAALAASETMRAELAQVLSALPGSADPYAEVARFAREKGHPLGRDDVKSLHGALFGPPQGDLTDDHLDAVSGGHSGVDWRNGGIWRG